MLASQETSLLGAQAKYCFAEPVANIERRPSLSSAGLVALRNEPRNLSRRSGAKN